MSRVPHISVLGSVSFGWLARQGGFRFAEPFFLDPLVRLEQERAMHAFVARQFPDEPIYSLEAHLVQLEGRRRPVVLVGGIQPNLIFGAALGSQFVFSPEADPDIRPAPMAQVRDLDPLWNIDWAGTYPISMFLEQIAQLRESHGERLAIVPPYFWDTTGRATTHGILTTAQKLLGERIFLDMNDDPVWTDELLAWIVDGYVRQIQLLADAAGIEINGFHTGDCSACMVGPGQFAERLAPRLNELSARLGPMRLHSCGRSDHLLEAFAELDGLASLNVGSNTSVAKIRERFGAIPIDVIPDLHLLGGGSPQEIDAWTRQCVEENASGPMQIQFHLDVGQSVENCIQINRTLAELGYPTARVEIY